VNSRGGPASLRELLEGVRVKPTLILLWAPFVLTTWRYFGTKAFYLNNLSTNFVFRGDPGLTAELYAFGSSFVLFGLCSLFIIKTVLGESVVEYGLALGDWRFGIKALLLLAPVMVLLAYPSARQAPFLAEYPLNPGACGSVAAFLGHAAAYLLYYVGFETLFRGLVQNGLRDSLGEWTAILVQTGLSTLMHIGKPAGEIYGAILGGVVFGLVALRSRSLVYVILIHWVLGVALDLFICLR
jgi:membrane protease YdiL (CAAX protease family)